MVIIRVALTDEGGALIAELARKANLPDPESFVRKAISVLGTGVQLEELGGSVVAIFPNGDRQPIECIQDPDPKGGVDPLKPPKTVPPRPGEKPDTFEKLGWLATGLQILREEKDT